MKQKTPLQALRATIQRNKAGNRLSDSDKKQAWYKQAHTRYTNKQIEAKEPLSRKVAPPMEKTGRDIENELKQKIREATGLKRVKLSGAKAYGAEINKKLQRGRAKIRKAERQEAKRRQAKEELRRGQGGGSIPQRPGVPKSQFFIIAENEPYFSVLSYDNAINPKNEREAYRAMKEGEESAIMDGKPELYRFVDEKGKEHYFTNVAEAERFMHLLYLRLDKIRRRALKEAKKGKTTEEAKKISGTEASPLITITQTITPGLVATEIIVTIPPMIKEFI